MHVGEINDKNHLQGNLASDRIVGNSYVHNIYIINKIWTSEAQNNQTVANIRHGSPILGNTLEKNYSRGQSVLSKKDCCSLQYVWWQLAGIRTKHPPDITPPAHFGIGGRNPPHVFYRVDITPPATFDRVDKTPLVSFARWTKSPLSCGQNPPRTKSPWC